MSSIIRFLKLPILLSLLVGSAYAQSYALAPAPKFLGLDNNGIPLSGGLLYVYQAGTSTPGISYTDSTGGTPNSNPVVLDSAGRANVWLNTALAYKFILQNSFGSTIWTVDNIKAVAGGGGGTGCTASGPVMAIQYNNGAGCGGTANAEVDANGNETLTGSLAIGLASPSSVGFSITGATSQSADLADFRNHASTLLVSINASGVLSPAAGLAVSNGNLIAQTITAGAAQTGDLLKVQSSALSPLLEVGSGGALTLNTISGSTQCLQVNSSGLVSGTGAACGAGGGGSAVGPANAIQTTNGSGTFQGTATGILTSTGVMTLNNGGTLLLDGQNGLISVSLGSAGSIGASIRGANGQSAFLFDVTSFGGTDLVGINSSGVLLAKQGATITGTTTLASITGSTQCLQVNTSGVVAGSGAGCGGGGGSAAGPANAIQFTNGSGVFQGTAQGTLDSSGNLTVAATLSTSGGINSYVTMQPHGYEIIKTDLTNAVPLTLIGAPSQASDLFDIENSSNTVLASVNATGVLSAFAGLAVSNGNLIAQTITAGAAQTGDLLKVQSSALSPLLEVGSGGALKLNTITGSTQCLQVNSVGLVSGTGAGCSGGSSVGVSGAIQTSNGSGGFLGTSNGTLDANGNVFLSAIYLGGQHGYMSVVGDGTVSPEVLIQGGTAQGRLLRVDLVGGNHNVELLSDSTSFLSYFYDGVGNGATNVIMQIAGHGFAPGHDKVYFNGGDRTTFPIDFPNIGAPVGGKTLQGYLPVFSVNGTGYYVAVYQ